MMSAENPPKSMLEYARKMGELNGNFGLDMVPEYSGHLIDDLNARVDNVIALAQLERVRKLCSSLFPEDIPCTHIAVTFCADCGREICLNCAEKFLMETYCQQCGEQERKRL